jgi:hypothetical protein
MKKRTGLIIALLLVIGLSLASLVFYLSNSSSSAFCEHPISPSHGKVRFGLGDRSESTSNIISIRQPTNQQPNQLDNTGPVEQLKAVGQPK